MRDARDSCAQPRSSTIRALLLGSMLAATIATPALAARHDHHQAATKPIADNTPVRPHRIEFVKRVADNPATAKLGAGSKLTKNAKGRIYASRNTGGLQCVPFARAASGIELKGNAVNWWDAAAGVYERGNRPEPSAVLNFRANGSMRLGHVAVVRRVVNGREIEIDHANWAWSGKGNISRGVAVIDVSARNDWTAVRVALGRGEDFGSIYSTYGFIYDRPDNGTMVANTTPRGTAGYDEIAEAPTPTPTATSFDAPVRSLR